MIEIIAILVLDGLENIVRGLDGLPGHPQDTRYRAWLMKHICEHEVIMGENAYRKLIGWSSALPCRRMVVLARKEHIQDLEIAAHHGPQKVYFVPRASLLVGGTSFAETLHQKKKSKREEKARRKMFILGGPHTLFRLVDVTSRLYLVRTNEVGYAKLQDGYLSRFPKETGKFEHGIIYGK